MKSSYQSLEEKMNEREEFFSKRELEFQELHRCEMAKGTIFFATDFKDLNFNGFQIKFYFQNNFCY